MTQNLQCEKVSQFLRIYLYFQTNEMARVYDLEQLIEPTLLGCDKARISIEVNIVFFKVGCVFLISFGLKLWN